MKYLLYCCILFPCFLKAQENCQGSFTEYYLNSNNIRASFFPRGNRFTDGNAGGFLAPYPSSGNLSTIFASSPWLAGLDFAGNLKMAAETYPVPQNFDFAVGPLNSIGIPYYDECANFDRTWSVFREDILLHMEDYYQDFKIDDTIPSIFGWPARGNKYFSRFNGFELPGNDVLGLAEFFDANGNGVYDPDAGDYPVLNYHSSNLIIPDQMMWMVFNDVDTLNPSGHRPIRAEFQVTAFAFHCQDKEWLNNTIFNKYRIIYRGLTPLDSAFFGFWTDYDLGCSEDDFMGSDSARRTEFVYNADMVDGDSGADCTTGSVTYAAKPPVQSMTWLSHPMHSFISTNRMNEIAFDEYYALNGLWGDGSLIRPYEDGYHQDTSLGTTKFHYHGDPRDTNSWAAINIFDEGMDVRSVSSISLGRINPGFFTEVYTAHMFHADPNADHLGQITHMFNNIDSLLAMSWHPHDPICTPVQTCMDDDCVWPGDFDKNGIADHRDYLTWSFLNEMTGAGRNGLVSWRGQYAEDWNEEYSGVDIKHGDGDGNGIVNLADIDINSENHLLTNRYFIPEANYPVGADVVIVADSFYNTSGIIRNLSVRAGHDFENMLGITFTIEFDTTLFTRSPVIYTWPEELSRLIYHPFTSSLSTHLDVAFVQTNRLGIDIESNTSLIRFLPNSLRIKPGVPIPDSTVIGLRNLKGIDADGNDLHIGSGPLVVYKEEIVGSIDLTQPNIFVYPNPTEGWIQILTDIKTEVRIFSLQGHLLKQVEVSEVSKPIDVTSLPSGMYILRIMATGESVKLVIE